MTLDIEVEELLFLMQLVSADMLEKKRNGADLLNEAQWTAETALFLRLTKLLPVSNSPIL